MLIHDTGTATTIEEDVRFLSSEQEERKTVKPSGQDTWKLIALCVTAATMSSDITFLSGDGEKPKIPNSSAQELSTSHGLRFEEEIEPVLTQVSSDTRHQHHLAFPSYDEEDILVWDTAIVTPPPRPSGSIRVKLKYRERSKPIPIEDPWAE